MGIAAAPTQVIRNPCRSDAFGQLFELFEVVRIEGMRPADGQRYAVHHQRIALGEGIEVIQSLAALHHEVFRDHFEPVDIRRLLKDLLIISTA
ncbi:hypothetical protein D3C81_1579770 [compost metagenome]